MVPAKVNGFLLLSKYNLHIMKNSGTLYVIAAPSGGGKTSLVNALLESQRNLKVSVSHTTRPQRPGEEEGVNYHFVNRNTFDTMVLQGKFIEHAFVHNQYYGTSKDWLEQQLNQGVDVILEIDWQGARQMRKQFPECISIFILPPSRAVLQARLHQRQQDDAVIIAERLAVASSEIAHCDEFDYIVVNDVFAEALRDLEAIVQAHSLRRELQLRKHSKLLADLVQS
jgi:guanylate kinase